MAKSEKKVSISSIDRTIHENFHNTFTEQWYETEICMKRHLSLTEMLTFVDEVVSVCFPSGGGFLPEAMEFAARSCIIKWYTNVSLPDNLEHRYEILYHTDIVDFVCQQIDSVQLEEIMAAIDRKIDYLCQSHVAAVQKKLDQLTVVLEDLREQAEAMFSGVTPEDIKKLTGAISSGSLSGEKIVDAYMNRIAKTDGTNGTDGKEMLNESRGGV